ncbi:MULTISPECIES: MarR family winged helix-turn-helix transcriptional regulator [Bacillales]|uniref:MarR family transcriptional regulator n=1 Tax=Cytobacillus firmus TaxID=1399 RepID=A0AA46P501_CYTFI|nr:MULTISPECIES: MarR family transcriptional regulator [Bacillales]MCC3649336.1 MarR family transcriptional regulator [Cytobacillus oceanisediminis]MCS0655680.1 MarR family transcriptional regulator [Cytobacillus firmus]OMF56542.1 MarR family transcriptional regulator [Paenibacillus sp. FSL R5-0490]UYG97166.1 MarR family transcriptional regulator [Cytobacillus firmus]WHY35133.1 MarR family transcriptional regulator [Cytobacillus firmus]
MHPNQSEFFHSINQFTRHFSKVLNESLVPLGLYAAQWTIIYRLKTGGPSTQKEISSYLGVEAPTMTRTLARLEKSGWITRTAGKDKREKLISLTDAAILEYDNWLAAVRSSESNVLQNITEEEISTMIRLMAKMRENMVPGT